MALNELELIPVNSNRLFNIFNKILQLYEYEFSNLTHTEINDTGLYQNIELEKHIKENSCSLFLLRFKNKWAGLSVVNLKSCLNDDPQVRDIAGFFVMKLYRKNRLGYRMAEKLFNMYPGKWEVKQLSNALEARHFWLRVIAHYTSL